jgi:AcrR family transcriptional regulator
MTCFGLTCGVDLTQDRAQPETLPKGPRTRAAIVRVAAGSFSISGYESTTLEGIAKQLGLSRGLVLFHFESKRALLMAVLEPLFVELEALVSRYQKYPTPLSPRPRRQLLTEYCDVIIAHREATILLSRDLTSIVQMRWPAGGSDLGLRMLTLLQGEDPDRSLKIRTSSVFGGIVRAVCVPQFDPEELDAEARHMIVHSALAAYAAKV